MAANWFVSLLRSLCMFLDWIVYNLVEQIYQLFLIISQTGIFTSESMQAFASRIYFFLGLLMIFKVSISIVQYILNPDSVKDSKIGASKLLKNLIIILLGIVLIPYIFEAAYNLQKIVLRDNIIGNLIIGGAGDNSDSSSTEYVNDAGTTMAFTTFNAFFKLNTGITDENGNQLISNECATLPINSDGNLNSEACNDSEQSIINAFLEADSKNSNLSNAYKEKKVYYFGQTDYNYQVGDYYLFDYTILVSTIAGGFIIWILLGFCIDIAVRNVKLGFLQLIAPIPLIAKVDPKKGDETFNKWTKECISTYLDLFIRVATIYFAVYLIGLISHGTFDIVTGEDTHNFLLDVFFILGILSFAKDLPKFIETLTGIKLDGKGFGLANRLKQVPLVGKPLGNAADKSLRLAGRTAKNTGKGLFNLGKNGALMGAGAIANSQLSKNMAANASARLAGFANTRAGRGFSKVAGGLSKAGKGISNIAGGFDSLTGNAFSEIGSDIRDTGASVGHGLLSSIGIRPDISKFDEEIGVLKKYSGYKDQMKKQSDFDSNNLTAAGGKVAGIKNNQLAHANLQLQAAAQGGTSSLENYCQQLKSNPTATAEEINGANRLLDTYKFEDSLASRSQEVLDAAEKGVKGLKQYYEDLKNSNASDSRIKEAREMYDLAQKFVISNSNDININNESINYIKQGAASYASSNSDVLGSAVTRDTSASYSQIDSGTIHANNEIIRIEQSDEYQRALSNKVKADKK